MDWNDRYSQTVLPLFNAVGGPRQALGNDILNAIQILKDNHFPVTTMMVSELLEETNRPWERALRGPAYSYLEGVIQYYLEWSELPTDLRKRINKERSDIKKGVI